MKKETIDVYICEFCGLKNENEDWMKLHESVCNKNPINMPCSVCENQILGVGCAHNVKMDEVGGNILCFFYKEGEPQNIFDALNNIEE